MAVMGVATAARAAAAGAKRGAAARAPRRGALAARRAAPRAAQEEDDDFEARLAAISAKTGSKRNLKEARKQAQKEAQEAMQGAKARGLTELPEEDMEGEEEYAAFRPSVGDLISNVALGATILWLPLSLASIGRFTWVRYRLTNKRLTVRSEPPVGEKERTDVAFEDVTDCITVGNLLWGDLLVTLKNGDKVELRSVDNFVEFKKYILKKAEEAKAGKVDALAPGAGSSSKGSSSGGAKAVSTGPSRTKGKGF